VRNRDPGKGKLDLPGGFVDPGEGVFEGLRRELLEELGLDLVPPGSPNPALFASFPNKYPYQNILYNTCDLFFSLEAPALTEGDLKLEKAEIAGIRFINPEELDFQDLAFESVRKAMGVYLEKGKDKSGAA
jgi:ADP-ribose pyrophosphatase YjhB (NUDIX family)